MKSEIRNPKSDMGKPGSPVRVNGWRATGAFTLIELLTVIAIMAVIAAMVFPILGAVKRQQYLKTAKAEMEQIGTALEDYHRQYGSYPPSSPSGPEYNQLYYELMGVTNSAGTFETLDGAAAIASANFNTAFGVAAPINCAKAGADPETAKAKSFLTSLRPNRIGTVNYSGVDISNLVTSVRGPDAAYKPVGVQDMNPFRYVYPGTNNPNGYDLWIDLRINGKTNRICNWRSSAYVL